MNRGVDRFMKKVIEEAGNGPRALSFPIGVFVSISLLLFTFNCKKGEVIESIGGHDIHTKEYEDYYATSVDMASRMAGADRTFVSRMVCNPESNLSTALRPSAHYNRYRDMLMVARVAEEEGFTDDPNVKRMLEQSRLQTLGQLYINARLLQAVDVPDDAKVKVCEALRKKDPQKMAHLSLDDCLEVAEGILKRRLVSQKSDQVVNSIRESISIKRNPKFPQKEYLKNLALYKTLLKKGGCEGQPKAGGSAAPKGKAPAGAKK